jgi:HEPN domain-containing protein
MTEAPLARARPRIDHPHELDRMVKQIVAKVDPVAIYLFGSRARGDADEDSDYDLMIVIPDERMNRQIWHDLRDAKTGIAPIGAELIPARASAFAWRRHDLGTLEYEAQLDGLVLYERPYDRLPAARVDAEVRRIQIVREWLQRAEWHLPVVHRCGSEVPDRASFHIQQAAEKLTKAALVAHGIRPRKGHQIGELAALLPDRYPDRARFLALDRLSDYAWAYQYPNSPGRPLPPEPTAEMVQVWAAEVEGLKADFERWLGQGASGAKGA